jgi:hypothetical protein
MSFFAQHITRTAFLTLSAPPEQVFPLFEPLGEKAWAADWDPAMLYPSSGTAAEGAVFTTRHPGEAETIWMLAEYDPRRYRLSYLRVTPNARAGNVAVECAATAEGGALARVTYTFTALSEHGNAYIAALTEARYGEWMAQWEAAINHYLRHGQPLAHH